MKNEFIDPVDFCNIILNGTPVVDVRAPMEFSMGSVPGSVNLVLMNDEERQLVGTCYKEQGQEAAIALGHRLVSGGKKESRIQDWVQFVRSHPQSVVTCFRGGLRSKISQSWLAEAGFERPRIRGGYKAFRQFLLEELERLSTTPMLVVSGGTGAGKTLLLKQIEKKIPMINLELLAKHRGSAFGAYDVVQPSQADFENLLAAELIKHEAQHQGLPLVVEDESRMIGKCVQPEKFFLTLRESGLVLIDEPLDERVRVIYDEYIKNLPQDRQRQTFLRYQNSLLSISKKLGGLRYQEIKNDLDRAIARAGEGGDLEEHKIWIKKLLVWYYDPLYFGSLQRRKPKILFRGSRSQAYEFLLGYRGFT